MRESEPQPASYLARYGKVAAIGFEFIGMVAGGAFVGVYLDAALDTSPWLSTGGVVIGTAGGLYRMIKVQRYLQGKDESSKD